MKQVESPEYQGESLEKRCFDGQDLSGVNFSDATLEGSTFRKSILRNADFRNANIRGCDFAGAVIDGANFAGAEAGLSETLFADILFRALGFSALMGVSFSDGSGSIEVDASKPTHAVATLVVPALMSLMASAIFLQSLYSSWVSHGTGSILSPGALALLFFIAFILLGRKAASQLKQLSSTSFVDVELTDVSLPDGCIDQE